ncbi:hypothetical protein DL96DRAFT_1614537 [Flagelloscypha sp. PMI_526]|nr:hypothetical protein DL96DRAFT_1614537 [Flagelloscypha sp. PMI_526]
MKEMCDVQAKLTRWESEGVALRAQVATFHAQASVISTETDRVRKDAITALFPAADFLEDTFKPRVLSAPDIPTFVASLNGTGALQKYRLYLLPKPPSCMPLRVQFCGSHGYWFAPTTVPPDDFELIVEGRAGEWTYLGKYVTAPFPGHEMRLAEWMNLDELTKLAYCARLHPSSGTQPQATSPVEIKRRHDIGEWVSPCYSLRCVGFSTDLYELLIQKLGTKAAATSAQQSSTTTPIVKNFAPVSTRKYASGGIEAGIGSPPLLVTSKRGKEECI